MDMKSQFPFFAQRRGENPWAYLDSAATTQKPLQVIRRLEGFYCTENANIHRGVHGLSEQATSKFENSRKRVKDHIGARSGSEVVFTSGTTESINLVAYSFGERYVKPGDEIVVTEMEHHSNLVPWQLLCDRKGASLKVVPIKDNGELDLEAYKNLLSEKTKLVAVCHVSNILGTVNPIEELIATAKSRGIAVLVDGAQATPHMAVDVTKLDCDFYVYSGHKAYASTGTGVLYGKERLLEEMPPFLCGGGMINKVSLDKTTWTCLPHKFEAGTPNIAGALSLEAAIDFIESTGFEQICERENSLFDYLIEQLGAIESVRILGKAQKRCAVVSFVLEGCQHLDVGMILDKCQVAVRTGLLCAEPLMKRLGVKGAIRASLGVYNDERDIDLLVSGLKKAQTMLR